VLEDSEPWMEVFQARVSYFAIGISAVVESEGLSKGELRSAFLKHPALYWFRHMREAMAYKKLHPRDPAQRARQF
jgi:hypothetical protein